MYAIRSYYGCNSWMRLIIWAWMETSSAETGSSQTMSFGLRIMARATPIRWHSLGDRAARLGFTTDASFDDVVNAYSYNFV